EDEARRRLVAPGGVIFRPLQRIERAIELDRGKNARSEFQLAALLVIRIEHAAPRRIAPAGDADADGGGRAAWHRHSSFSCVRLDLPPGIDIAPAVFVTPSYRFRRPF